MVFIDWLTPWEFSPVLLVSFAVCAGLFVAGARKHKVNRSRQYLFWLGFVLLYLSLHTRIDYYAERLFFAHRLQHLVLHHLGPLLIMGAYPGAVFWSALPLRTRQGLRQFGGTLWGRWLRAFLTNKYWVPFLFVFLVLVWLEPTVQFYSMLDWRLYRFMNWSVVLSGLMYWNLILDRRPSPPSPISPIGRVFSPLITMTPQIAAGAVITFANYDLYPIFDLCGRAIPGLSAVTDQVIGGLVMWVLAGFVEVFGVVFALFTLLRLSAAGRLRPRSSSSNRLVPSSLSGRQS